MSLKEFFAKARRGRKWAEDVFGQVRCANGFCPLGAVAQFRDDDGGTGDVVKSPWPYLVQDKLGLSPKIAARIAQAADERKSRHRKWLLKNLGVGPQREETR